MYYNNMRLYIALITLLAGFRSVHLQQQRQQPAKPFSCEGRPSGYYADIQSGCQVYHMCDGLGRQFSYSCPNTTLFQQRMLICDHWYMVNCSKAELDYTANLLIGQHTPFINDQHPYERTPRPDLLDTIYRHGRAHDTPAIQNLIGGIPDLDNDETQSHVTDKPYLLPTHWSTEYSLRRSDNNANELQQQNDNNKVNFPSRYKATTPNYPKVAPPDSDGFEAALRNLLSPPDLINRELASSNVNEDSHNVPNHSNFASKSNVNEESHNIPNHGNFASKSFNTNEGGQQALPQHFNTANFASKSSNINSDHDVNVVNFASNFKATTPVYPRFVAAEQPLADQDRPHTGNSAYGLSSIVEPPKPESSIAAAAPSSSFSSSNNNEHVVVNFKSDFKATTPVYPKFVDVQDDLPVADPLKNHPNSLSIIVQPPRNLAGAAQQQNQQHQPPSIYYQAPRLLNLVNIPESSTESDWKALRQIFLIPDYEFPLDASALRPSYEQGGVSSFRGAEDVKSYELSPRTHAKKK